MTEEQTENSTEQIVSSLLSKKTSILELIQTLGSKLTSANPSDRETALELLVAVLCSLPNDLLAALEVATLLEFLCAKLSDSNVLIAAPTIKGIHHLIVHSRNLPDGIERMVFKALLQDQTVQSWPHQDRYYIFAVIDFWLDNRLEGLHQLGPEFLLGFMQAIEGERDPRCLMMVFHLFQRVVALFSLGPFAGDMFELVACYFPIDFKPPANDPYGITSEQLATALEGCLLSHPSFASLCYDLVQEKLVDPETDSAKKIPCFDLLVAACDRFPPAALKDYIDGLWDGIRLEALNPAEKGLRHPESLLNALATIIRTSQQLTSAEGLNSDLVALLEKILSSCEPFVLQAEIGMAPRTLTVLQAVARIDSKICCRIAEKVLPWLMELAQGSTVNSVNRAEIAAESTPTLAEWCHLVVEMDSASSFTPRLRDALTRLSLDILCRSATISTVAAGFSIGETLAATSDFKTDADDLVQLSKLALKAVVAFSDFEQVREACHLYLRAVAMKNWPIFNREIVPMLKSDVVAERLMVVAYSIHDTTSANVLFPSLIDLFKSAQYEDLAENVLLSLPVVFHLNEGNDQLINTCLGKALPVIIDWAQENHSAVDSVAICLQDISLELGEQEEVYLTTKLCAAVKAANVHKLPYVLKTVHLALVCARATNGELLSKTMDEVGAKMESVSAEVIAIRAALINKCDDLWEKELAELEKHCFANPIAQCLIAKALLFRNRQPAALDYVNKLFALLAADRNSTMTEACRNLFDFSARNSDPEKCRYEATLLWKQRWMSQTVPLFIKHFNNTRDDAKRERFFQVLGDILSFAQGVSASSSASEMTKLMPVLIVALESEMSLGTAELVVGALVTLLETEAAESALEPHIASVVERLLQLAGSEDHVAGQLQSLKMKALKCLELMPKRFAPSVLSSSRRAVTKKLQSVTMDKKRLVRRAAADANNRWSMI